MEIVKEKSEVKKKKSTKRKAQIPEENPKECVDIASEILPTEMEATESVENEISSKSEIENLNTEIDIEFPTETDLNKNEISEIAQEDTVSNSVEQSSQAIQDIPNNTQNNPTVNIQENGDFGRLLNKSKDLMEKIKLTEFTETEKVEMKSQVDKIELTIKPYSESQLSALYHNSELDTLEGFISQFVEAELKGLSVKNHPLYELLTNYLRVREKITVNNLELDQTRKEYNQLQQELWTIEPASVNGRGECQDGTAVVVSHTYNRSIFHRSVFQSIIRMLGNIRKLTYENHTLYTYSAEDLRLQIEIYLQGVVLNCINVTQLNKDAPIAFTLQEEPHHLKPYIGEIRICISILFAFQRKLIREMQFVKETRLWLSQLVAVLLRVANYQDHLFILNHILRCPAGVASWSTPFIQAPLTVNLTESPFSNYQINHILSILATILSPIKSRDKFLEDISQGNDMATEALWVMVDSDGEDEEMGTNLKENDLVGLINQLPLDEMFRGLLLVQKRNFEDIYNSELITEHHILRYFAFSTILLKILHRGIQTYSQPRYNQFSKRLSRFIRHVVQYATDQWQQYLKVQDLDDKAMLKRLQVEYDAFFLRAIYYLYSSQKLGAWQFLAVIPYNMVTLKTLWKIFYFLHNSDQQAIEILNPLNNQEYSKQIWQEGLRTQFEEKLGNLEDAEVYYLLNTFANMALERSEQDIDFIFSATMDLLKVGFLSLATQESCCKSARILLTHITSKYPHLLSNILKEVKNNLETVGNLALYLYEELPLQIWKITDHDIDIISRLLLNNSSAAVETKLARMILSRLNWEQISYELHCDVACLVVSATLKEPSLEHWAWQMIMRLKLHISDRIFQEIGRVQEIERYAVLSTGVRQRHCLSIFVTLLMTTWGHLVPLVCTKGFIEILYLLTQQKYEAVLFILYQIVPLFLTSQECLINSEKYQEILQNLLNADRGYISMAKSFVFTQNTVLQQFGNMIETQIVNFNFYGLDSPRSLVRLWVNSLVSIQTWNKDMGIMYLLNVIIRTSFQFSDSLEVVYDILRDQQQCASSPQDSPGTISSLFKWVASNNTNGSLISNSLSSYTWLAYVMITVEHQEREVHSGLWNEILIQLSKQKGKVNIDQAIKKASSTLKVPPFTSGYLSIYRWAQQALDTPLDHPLLPLLWQKFFFLYLARIPTTSVVDKSCIGEKFFDGLVNFAFQKKIKRRLQETVDYFKCKLEVKDDDNQELEKKEFYENCHKVFRAFLLWLEEPRLQENNLLLQNLPPQYEPPLLMLIMEGLNTPWYQFLDYEKLKQEQYMSTRSWRVANFREKTNVNQPLVNAGSRTESDDPVERILRRLTSYDAPKPPPSIKISAPVIPKVEFGSKEEMMKSLEPCFKIFQQFARNHMLKVSEYKALNCNYQELLPQLYRSVMNKIKIKVPCKGKNQTVHCSGAAVIILEVQEARINDRVDHQLQTNRSSYESLLSTALQSTPINLCSASVTLQQTIKALQQQLNCNPATQELGADLFYYILSLLNEETTNYPPTKSLFSTCLERLGQSHISNFEFEMPRLLQKILNEATLGEYLAPHFFPNNVGTTNLLLMYSTISKEIGQKYDITFALLSKFEIDSWLHNKRPKLNQRSQFIQSIVKALTTLGFDPPVEALTLHGLYRKHLLTVFEYQFPEHYGEVLVQLLKASNGNPETNLLALSVWMDILNSLAQPVTLHLKVPLREQLRQYAQHQKMLQHQVLLETAELLSKHFTQERLQYGLYGLYPKCRNYMDVFVLLLGVIGHGVIVSMLNTHQGLLGDKLCEKIWPYLRDMFSPWIVPYSMQNLKDNMASWIQQLADDRSILLPWIPPDVGFAQKVLNAFHECISFVIHTLPASSCIMSYIWQWYATCYAHNSVKEHILSPIHQTFLSFPWQKFWPSIVDIEYMLRVVDQYLPECHSFLGQIFISVPWANWLNNFNNAPLQIKSRVYQCFINLIVKLSNEPNIRKKFTEQAKSLLVQAENFDWTVLEPAHYQHVLDWFVMSCDSSVIFKSDPLDLDYRVLHFLKIVSGYNKQLISPTSEVLYKRLIFVKTYIKLLSVYVNRHKNNIGRKEQDIQILISRQLHNLETLVDTEEEMTVLMRELMCILNINNISEPTSKAFSKWIENKPGNGIIMKSFLKCLGQSVRDNDILSDLLEIAINSYFVNTVTEDFQPNWREVGELVNILVSKQTELEQMILSKGHILTLNAIFVQRISKCADPSTLLNICLDWMTNIKINESVESKVPLIWNGFLMLVLQHSETDEPYCGAILRKCSEILLQFSDDRGGNKWGRGLLSAIGLSRQETLSINFRFLCRALAGYILAQLPDMKGEAQVIRRVANAPAKVGQPGGNTECVKVLLTLDFGQSQGKIKECAELALKQIQDPNNSLHNARRFLNLLVQQFYMKPYLKDIG